MEQIPVKIAIEKFINIHRAVSSPKTVEYYEDCLFKFENFLFDHNVIYCNEINQDNFIEYVKSLRDTGIKNVSVNTYTRAIRAFNTWILNNGYVEKSFTVGVKQLRDDSKQILPLTIGQVERIDNYYLRPYCSDYFLRNYIIFHLMLDCGLRRNEVIKLNKQDVHHNCLVIRNSKFNKSRLVPLPEFLLDRILQYTDISSPGPLLLCINGKRITVNCIKKMFCNLQKWVLKDVHPHLLRHTFATSYVVGGGNLEFLRIILGHASYDITQRYLHVAAQCMISDVDVYRLDKCFFKNYNNGGY